MVKINYETSSKSTLSYRRITQTEVMRRKKEWEGMVQKRYKRNLKESKLLFKIDTALGK